MDALEEMIIKQAEKQQNYTRELIAQLISQDIPVSPPKEGDSDSVTEDDTSPTWSDVVSNQGVYERTTVRREQRKKHCYTQITRK